MLSSLGLTALGTFARALPPGPGYALARAGARLHFRLASSRRAAIRINLRQALAFARDRSSGGAADFPLGGGGPVRRHGLFDRHPAAGRDAALDRLVAGAFESHGAFLYEWLRSAGGAPATLTLDGRAHLDRALARGRGAILAACHLGNWEVAACELARAGYPLAVVTGDQLGWLASAVRRDKEQRGIRTWRQEDGARALYRTLAENRILVLLVDGDVWRSGLMVSFLGRRTLLPGGAVHLARATGAPLLAGTMRRTGPLTFHACVHAPMTLRAGDSPEDMLRALVAPLEGAIARDPTQWCLFRSLWAESPAGAKSKAAKAKARNAA